MTANTMALRLAGGTVTCEARILAWVGGGATVRRREHFTVIYVDLIDSN